LTEKEVVMNMKIKEPRRVLKKALRPRDCEKYCGVKFGECVFLHERGGRYYCGKEIEEFRLLIRR
jgi:hypothetical protein